MLRSLHSMYAYSNTTSTHHPYVHKQVDLLRNYRALCGSVRSNGTHTTPWCDNSPVEACHASTTGVQL